MQFLSTRQFWICAVAAVILSVGLSYFIALPECVLFSVLLVVGAWASFRALAWRDVTSGERTRFAIVVVVTALGFVADLAAWQGNWYMLFQPMEQRITERVGREVAAEIAGDPDFKLVRLKFWGGKWQCMAMEGVVDSEEALARLKDVVERNKLPDEKHSRICNHVKVRTDSEGSL